MTKAPLSKDEIIRLSSLLKEVFKHISELRQKDLLAKKIQMPKIPPILTESLCCSCAKSLFGQYSTTKLGGKECDILLQTPAGKRKIEVKATGKSRFEYFGKKDIAADYLVWINFGDYFEKEKDSLIEIYLLENPAKSFHSPIKITLNKFKKLTSGRGLRRFQAVGIKDITEGTLSTNVT